MRKMTLALIAWCAGIAIWAAAGAMHAASTCSTHYRAGTILHNACVAGAGLGVAAILGVGVVGFVLLSLVWLMTKPDKRYCPTCGNDIRRGATICVHCHHDFLDPSLAAVA